MMNPLRDEDLIGDPVIRQAVEAWRAALAQPVHTRSRPRLIAWLPIVVAIGLLLIVLISLSRLG